MNELNLNQFKTKNQMEEKSETPLIDLAPKLFTTVKTAQDVLAKWIVPESGISDADALNELLGILDDSKLVRSMRDVDGGILQKHWSESPNIERTRYYAAERILEIEFKGGNIYHYKEVPLELWRELINAVSIGSFMKNKVKGYYSYIQQ